ncbi:hypothetical protein FHR61_003867 [Xanthomonas arboricola]|uniref:Uncharacterized protein n=1 Tax=Xanthomonas cannabis TaxID=1885674 RepID=A0ABR6JQR5_9XANT|nr:hypothetical protein [Xanthomonas cannabis]MBB5523977.1 hypothetical protein [Xanthomonas cannabis]
MAAQVPAALQLRRIHGQRIACDQRTAVEQAACHSRLHIARGGQTAGRGHRAGLKTQIAPCMAATVGIHRAGPQIQVAARRDRATLRDVDHASVQCNRLRSDQLPLHLQATTGLHVRALPGLCQPAQAHGVATDNAQCGCRIQRTECIDRAGIQRNRATTLQDARQSDPVGTCGNARAAVSHAGAAQHAVGAQLQRAGGMQAAIGGQFRTEQTDRSCAATANMIQGTAGLRIQCASGHQVSRKIHASSPQGHIALL